MDFVDILVGLVLVLAAARLCGWLAKRLGQPAVLGELVGGVLLGPTLLGARLPIPALGTPDAHALELVSEFGAIVLLLAIGLETPLAGMRKVGRSSLVVALIGIAVSFVLGYAASWALAKQWPSWHVADAALPANLLHVLVGAALTATSVGITARVLGELGKSTTPEARIILGAAVLDDIGGLLMLSGVAAAVTAATTGTGLAASGLLIIAGKAFGFLLVSLVVGRYLVRPAIHVVARIPIPGVGLAALLLVAVGFAIAAHWAGLATIVGAFVAGMSLAGTSITHDLERRLKPVAWLAVPFFFAMLGMRVDLGAMQGHEQAVIALGGLLALVAVLAKLACGWGVVRGQANRLVVGVGMAPRGEVGLIFAGLGLSSGVLSTWQYATLVLVAFLTTIVTPAWLKALRGRFSSGEAA